MIVMNRITKPQKVKKWARPGMGRLSSLRWPKTSTSSAHRRGLRSLNRSGAGLPTATRRPSHHTRRPASAMATAVNAKPIPSLKAFLLPLHWAPTQQPGSGWGPADQARDEPGHITYPPLGAPTGDAEAPPPARPDVS